VERERSPENHITYRPQNTHLTTQPFHHLTKTALCPS
jgi:hypothetical protein